MPSVWMTWTHSWQTILARELDAPSRRRRQRIMKGETPFGVWCYYCLTKWQQCLMSHQRLPRAAVRWMRRLAGRSSKVMEHLHVWPIFNSHFVSWMTASVHNKIYSFASMIQVLCCYRDTWLKLFGILQREGQSSHCEDITLGDAKGQRQYVTALPPPRGLQRQRFIVCSWQTKSTWCWLAPFNFDWSTLVNFVCCTRSGRTEISKILLKVHWLHWEAHLKSTNEPFSCLI